MISEPLRPSDFAQFFSEVNRGLTPFPWQERLAGSVCTDGKWPECLDLPTGTGKTAVLEIAVFHLALEARRLTERRAPVRMTFVVDRRLIVDQAERRAREIRDQLASASAGSITGKLARELSFLSGEGNPCLKVAKLRGGIPQEKDWARTPVQPTILLSTVDQVGSRLLFRGYGVSDSMKPVHAGLLGSDCLIFLDEAHLSEPFRQTLTWIGRYRSAPWSEMQPGPWSVVNLSATPGLRHGAVFRLDSADLENETLRKRVEATKPADLRQISGEGTAHEYAATARKLSEPEGASKILIVVNRVDLARAIFRELENDGAILMTGRVREVDRNRIVEDLLARMKRPDEKLFAVATQCVEAGADLDFDALVTQLAPLDSLRQRFGRLNRTGRDISAKAVILATKDEIRPKKPDPIYGFGMREAWKLMETVAKSEDAGGSIDFGVLSLEQALKNRDVEAACCEKKNAPVIPPAYVDLWARTSPRPSADPDVALFLHGPESGPADVQIVWRADILPGDLMRDDKREALQRLKELLAVVPPRPGETLAVPVWKVRDWLAAQDKSAARLSDLEGEKEPEGSPSGGRPVLRWFGADNERTQVIWANKISPGDLVIVPASYGGSDKWGWTGSGEPPVDDVGLEAAEQFGARDVVVRLHPKLLGETWEEVREVLENAEGPAEVRKGLLPLLSLPELCGKALRSIEDGSEELAFSYDEENVSGGLVLRGRRAKEEHEDQDRLGTASTEDDDAGDHAADQATLESHTEAVRAQVLAFADRTGVNKSLRRSIEFAAELHDAGKGDGRFQSCLHNGSPSVEILAKSKTRLGPARERQLRKRFEVPDHWRHEALSVRLALQHPSYCSEEHGMDRELALWLIGTHHGHGRPFFPHDDRLDDRSRHVNGPRGELITLEAAPGPQRLDFNWEGRDWPELFDLLRRRYGTWELARLEAILRLADHRASEE